jgi:hypothetical protein
MSTEEINDVQAAARRLIEQDIQARLDIIEELVDDQRTVDELAARLAEAEQRHARHYAEAERLGWSLSELKKLKLRAPARKAPGRPGRGKSGGRPTGGGSTGGGSNNNASGIAAQGGPEAAPSPPSSAAAPQVAPDPAAGNWS